MNLFKKRQQLLKQLVYTSPPKEETLHAYEEDILSPSEHLEKRRRIEAYARDYLSGRELPIASARLRGPFGKEWRNPWRKTTARSFKVTKNISKRASSGGSDIAGAAAVVPETVVQPARGSSAKYCNDWLRKQTTEQFSLQDGDEDNDGDAETDSHLGRGASPMPEVGAIRSRAGSRTLRPNIQIFDPAWTRDQSHDISEELGEPAKVTTFDSLRVHPETYATVSSATERSLRNKTTSSMFAPKRFRSIDEDLAKVSAITEDEHPPKRTKLVKNRLRTDDPDSPGFVFRRVGDSKRPRSKGTLVTRRNAEVLNKDSIMDDGTDIPSPSEDIRTREPVEAVPLITDPESVAMYVNSEGKWPCPMPNCHKRPRPYAAGGTLVNHLKLKHDVTRCHVDNTWVAVGQSRKRSTSGSNSDSSRQFPTRKTATLRTVSEVAPTLDVLKEQAPVDDGVSRLPHANLAAEEAEKQEQEREADIRCEIESLRVEEQEEPLETTLHEGDTDAEAMQPEKLHMASKTAKSRIEEDGGNAANASMSTVTLVDGNAHEVAAEENTGSQQLPNRQDSRAYSIMPSNVDHFSTQAALFQAHTAFHETQKQDEAAKAMPQSLGSISELVKPSSQPVSKSDDGRDQQDMQTTSQQQVDLIASARPDIISAGTQLANTQALMYAAADLSFSTAKKTRTARKRASFAEHNTKLNWPVAKPSQTISTTRKSVDWTPVQADENQTPLVPGTVDARPQSQPAQDSPLFRLGATAESKPLRSTLSFSSAPPLQVTHQSSHKPMKSSLAAKNTLDALSGVPVASYEPAQERERIYSSPELEQMLDEAQSFLSTWDVNREIALDAERPKM